MFTAYTAQYKEERSLDWNYAVNRTWTPDTPYVVENLRPQTMYTFRYEINIIFQAISLLYNTSIDLLLEMM